MSASPLLTRQTTLALAAAVALGGMALSIAGELPNLRVPPDRLPAELDIAYIPLGLPGQTPPDDNQLSIQRAQLGRKLFFDPLLSADGTLSCAGCHLPDRGFASPEPVALGIGGKRGTRNTPSLLNRGYGKSFFWDGRAPTLELQALGPIENPLELATSVVAVLEKLRSSNEYQQLFAAAYPGGISSENLARALASFERVLLSGNSRVDQFQSAKYSALSAAERQGLWLFESRARCWRCHSGPNYSDEAFHNTGIAARQPIPDEGRFAITKNPVERGAFKTPTLRDVALTAPYMHDGSLATLRDVIEFYNRGGEKNLHLDPLITPLNLSPAEVDQLVAFLQALAASTEAKTDAAAAQ